MSSQQGQVPGSQAAAPKKGCCGCTGCLLTGCLVLILLLVVGGVGGYVALKDGILTQRTLLTLIGQGPSTIEVDNFRDDAINVAVTGLDTTEGAVSFADETISLNAYDIKLYQARTPGKYRLDFSTASGAQLGTCSLTVRSADKYQFVVLPQRIAVNRVNHPPTLGRDLLIETSALCR